MGRGPSGSCGQIGGPSGRHGTGRQNLEEVWDRSGTLGEVWDGS